jgi:hypothetical protein
MRLEFHIYIVAVELMQPHFADEDRRLRWRACRRDAG